MVRKIAKGKECSYYSNVNVKKGYKLVLYMSRPLELLYILWCFDF